MGKYVKKSFQVEGKSLVSYSLAILILLELASALQFCPIVTTIFYVIESFQILACAKET